MGIVTYCQDSKFAFITIPELDIHPLNWSNSRELCIHYPVKFKGLFVFVLLSQ